MDIQIIYDEANKSLKDYKNFLDHFQVIIKGFKLNYNLINLDFKNKKNRNLNIDEDDVIILLAQNLYLKQNQDFLSKLFSSVRKDKAFIILFRLDINYLEFFNTYRAYLFFDRKDNLDTAASQEIYWTKLIELLYDINQTNDIKTNLKAIYLADTSESLSTTRASIKRELQKRGYTVLPRINVKYTYLKGLKNNIQDSLKQCCITIHFFDEKYDNPLAKHNQSLPDLENTLVKECLKEQPNLNQFIWLSTPIENVIDIKQKSFINKLEQESYDNSQIIRGTLEEFKDIIFTFLERQNQKESEVVKAKTYYIFDSIDKITSENFIKFKNNMDGLVFSFKHTNTKFEQHIDRVTHQLYLKQCNNCIIFFDKASRNWVYTNLQDVIKSLGMENKNPWDTVFLVYTPKSEANLSSIKERYINYSHLFKFCDINTFESKILQTIK